MLNFIFLEQDLGVVFSPHFVHDFSRKRFSSYNLLSDQISLPDCLYLLRHWAIQVCDIINFVVNLIFLIKLFFYLTKTLSQKFHYLEKEKELLKINKNNFSSFLRTFWLPNIVSDFRVRL